MYSGQIRQVFKSAVYPVKKDSGFFICPGVHSRFFLYGRNGFKYEKKGKKANGRLIRAFCRYHVIGLCNQKSGVRKTTTAVNLGIGLVRQAHSIDKAYCNIKFLQFFLYLGLLIDFPLKISGSIYDDYYATGD